MEWPLPVSNRKLVLGGVYFKPDLQRPSQIMNLKTQPADGYTKTSLGFFALCGGGSQRHNKKKGEVMNLKGSQQDMGGIEGERQKGGTDVNIVLI